MAAMKKRTAGKEKTLESIQREMLVRLGPFWKVDEEREEPEKIRKPRAGRIRSVA